MQIEFGFGGQGCYYADDQFAVNSTAYASQNAGKRFYLTGLVEV